MAESWGVGGRVRWRGALEESIQEIDGRTTLDRFSAAASLRRCLGSVPFCASADLGLAWTWIRARGERVFRPRTAFFARPTVGLRLSALISSGRWRLEPELGLAWQLEPPRATVEGISQSFGLEPWSASAGVTGWFELF